MYLINDATGAATKSGTQQLCSTLLVSKDKKIAVTQCQATSSFESYQVDAQTGLLKHLGSVTSQALSNGALAVMNSSGDHLYAMSNNQLSTFTLESQTGGMLEVGSPITLNATCDFPTMAIAPSGGQLYVACWGHEIQIYSLSKNGSPSFQQSFSSEGADYAWITVDPSGRFLFSANQIPNTVSTFAIDSDLGALSDLHVFNMSGDYYPDTVYQDPLGKFLFTLNADTSAPSQLKVNNDGSLTKIADINSSYGQWPIFAFANDFAFGANGAAVSIFKIDSAGGMNFFVSLPTAENVQNVQTIEF